MKVSLSKKTVTRMLWTHLCKLNEEQKHMFFDKFITSNGENLEQLMDFVKSPIKFRHINTNGHNIGIGDTVYIDAEHMWTSDKEEKIKNNTIIDGTLRPATVVDFEFIPETRMVVQFHDVKDKKETQAIGNHYLVKTEFI